MISRLVLFALGMKGMGGGSRRALSYCEVAAAMKGMQGNNYADMVFRNSVVSREAKGGAAAGEILLHAERSDEVHMLCFLRWLDRNCDGSVSAKDFTAACNLVADVRGAPEHVKRWQMAQVKTERPNLRGATRGVLDKIGGRLKMLSDDGKVKEKGAAASAPAASVEPT